MLQTGCLCCLCIQIPYGAVTNVLPITQQWLFHQRGNVGAVTTNTCLFLKPLLVYTYISSLLQWNLGSYQTRSDNWLTLRVPSEGSDLGKTAFLFDAPSTRNALQQTLKLEVLPSATVFKHLVLNLCSSNCNCF